MIDPELIDDGPTVNDRLLRQFAAIWLAVFAGLSAWSVYRGHDVRAIVFALLALTAGPLGLISPRAIEPVFATFGAITRPIGLVMTRVILGLVFYLVFTPLALLFKLVRRDALHRQRKGGDGTYWVGRSLAADARRYFRQY